MAIAQVSQVNWNGNGSDPSAGITTTGATLLTMWITAYTGGSVIAAPVPTDSKGNTWTLVKANNPGAGWSTASWLFYSVPTTVGTGHTFSAGLGASTYQGTVAHAWSGTHPTAPLDQSVTALDGAGLQPSTMQGGSLTPSVANSLFLTCEWDFNNTGADATKTVSAPFSTPFGSAGTFAVNIAAETAFQIQTTIAAENPTWTLSTTTNQFDFGVTNAVFKPPAAAFTGSITATAASSDTTVGALRATAALIDSSASSDTTVGALRSTSAPADSAASSDTTVGALRSTFAPADSVATSDSFTSVMKATAALTDSSATSDVEAPLGLSTATLTDTSATSDSLSSGFSYTGTGSDTTATSDALTTALKATIALTDSTTTSDSLTAVMVASAALTDSVTSSDGVTVPARPGIHDTLATSDAFTTTSPHTSLREIVATSDVFAVTLVAHETITDSIATSDMLPYTGSHYTVTLSDTLRSGDVFRGPTVPPRQSSILVPTKKGILPLISGGAEAYQNREMDRMSTMMSLTLALTPQAATEPPPTPWLDGMKRLARAPWRPVAGQTQDAWVYWDAAGQEWLYEGTNPTSTI